MKSMLTLCGQGQLVTIAPDGDDQAGVSGVWLHPLSYTVDALLDLLICSKLLTPGSSQGDLPPEN